MKKDTILNKNICKNCGEQYDTLERIRVYGNNPFMQGYCSAGCYTEGALMNTNPISEHPQEQVQEQSKKEVSTPLHESKEVGGEKDGTTQKVATALLRHAVSEHKFVSDYSQTEKQMFRAGFIHGDVQGNEAGCVWGLNQRKSENESLTLRNKELVEHLKGFVDSMDNYVNSTEGHGCVPHGFTGTQFEKAKALIEANQIK